ncbi:hypothetical protein EAO74_20975 [Streptomyces sp. gb1(2016)]|uniref:Uncharacterized protein n=1 Tax=Streptomyces sp. gb1(2016) TaxID=1828321 RepID=A0A652KRL1_9ACTN|nr:hypothetical protein EAO74_20975 [Streptomyces sp. gb1(2016)]
MGYTLEELIEKQRAVDEAHGHVEELRKRFGPPSAESLTPAQTVAQETAWRAWRDLTRDMQNAVAQHAKETGRPRPDVEHDVRRRAGPAPDAQP